MNDDFELMAITSPDIYELEEAEERAKLEGWETVEKGVISRVQTHDHPEGVDVYRVLMRRSTERCHSMSSSDVVL